MEATKSSVAENEILQDIPQGEATGLSQEDLERMIRAKQHVLDALPRFIVVGGKKYKVRQVSQKIRTKIDNLALTAYYLQEQTKAEITLRRARRLNTKLRSTHSKIAAYYLLGNWALAFPFLWSFKWRRLLWRNSETMFKINDAGASDPDTSFYFANWEIIKGILALSTRTVGEGIKQFAQRQESAENMLVEDALPKKKEDSKLGRSSRKAPTTRR